MTETRLRGVIAAIATACDERNEIDLSRSLRLARFLLDNGCDGLNVLGTTGEATSFSLSQRQRLMSAYKSDGLPLDRLMVGTGAASVADAISLTQHAADLGFSGALVIPPFYYKGVPDDGLEAYIAAIVAATADKPVLGRPFVIKRRGAARAREPELSRVPCGATASPRGGARAHHQPLHRQPLLAIGRHQPLALDNEAASPVVPSTLRLPSQPLSADGAARPSERVTASMSLWSSQAVAMHHQHAAQGCFGPRFSYSFSLCRGQCLAHLPRGRLTVGWGPIPPRQEEAAPSLAEYFASPPPPAK